MFSAKEEAPDGPLHHSLLRAVASDARISSSYGERMLYSRDQSEVPRFMRELLFDPVPDAVVQPRSTEAVLAALMFASSSGLPVVPRGAGSSPFGGSMPAKGGLVVDMSRMDRVVEVDPVGKTATVQAGAR